MSERSGPSTGSRSRQWAVASKRRQTGLSLLKQASGVTTVTAVVDLQNDGRRQAVHLRNHLAVMQAVFARLPSVSEYE